MGATEAADLVALERSAMLIAPTRLENAGCSHHDDGYCCLHSTMSVDLIKHPAHAARACSGRKQKKPRLSERRMRVRSDPAKRHRTAVMPVGSAASGRSRSPPKAYFPNRFTSGPVRWCTARDVAEQRPGYRFCNGAHRGGEGNAHVHSPTHTHADARSTQCRRRARSRSLVARAASSIRRASALASPHGPHSVCRSALT